MTEKCNETFRVAVYGTLLSGERNEHWAAGALSRVPCVIRGVLYNTGWGFPAFVPEADGQKVRAELLTIDAAGLARMDTLEGYPNFYRREEVFAALPDGTEVSAMVYVMNRLPPRAAVIASGDWRNR
ncbi:MAG: gamma-glutamylcyclotransferase [Oligosphaeraceae bacterium]